MASVVQIAFFSMPCDPPSVMILGQIVDFFPDPDGSKSWLAEVTEEQAQAVLPVTGYSLWLPAKAEALVPDKTWTVMGLVAYAQETLGLTLDPKTGKAAVLAAIAAGAAAPVADPAPAAAAAAPSPALAAIQAAEVALQAAEAAATPQS